MKQYYKMVLQKIASPTHSQQLATRAKLISILTEEEINMNSEQIDYMLMQLIVDSEDIDNLRVSCLEGRLALASI